MHEFGLELYQCNYFIYVWQCAYLGLKSVVAAGVKLKRRFLYVGNTSAATQTAHLHGTCVCVVLYLF